MIVSWKLGFQYNFFESWIFWIGLIQLFFGTNNSLDLRYTLVVLTMFLVASVLGPVLWYLWIHAGSANANFFFAMTLVYCLAQVGCYGIDVCMLVYLLRLEHGAMKHLLSHRCFSSVIPSMHFWYTTTTFSMAYQEWTRMGNPSNSNWHRFAHLC